MKEAFLLRQNNKNGNWAKESFGSKYTSKEYHPNKLDVNEVTM